MTDKPDSSNVKAGDLKAAIKHLYEFHGCTGSFREECRLFNRTALETAAAKFISSNEPASAEPSGGGLNCYADECHAANRKWWYTEDGKNLERNKGEMLMLIVSEVSEAMEGERKDLMDTHLAHRKMAEVELADVLIRVFDYAAAHGYDLEGAYHEKMEYNKNRSDHSYKARAEANGKKW